MAIIGISGKLYSGKDTVAKIIQFIVASHNFNNGSILETLKKQGPFGYDYSKISGWANKKFAAKVKEFASSLLGVPVEKFEDQKFKSTKLGPEWSAYKVAWKAGDEGPGSQSFDTKQGAIDFMNDCFEDGYEEDMVTFEEMTVREFLQKLGTDAIRDGLHENAWVNALFVDYKRPSHWEKRYYDEKNKIGHSGDEEVWGDLPNWLITDVRFPNEFKAIKEKDGIVIRVDRMQAVSRQAESTEDTVGVMQHPSEIALDDAKFDYKINNNGSLKQLFEEVESFWRWYIMREANPLRSGAAEGGLM